jgi:type I restriction enzyme S subunit
MNKVQLGDIGKFARGKSKHRPRNDKILYEGGGFPLVQTGDIKNALLYINTHSQEYNSIGLKQSKLWGKGTLAITIAANIAETAILNYPMCFPDSVVGFIADKNKTSELFVHYLLSNIRRNIQSNVQGSGTSQDNINLEYLENFEVEIPSVRYQSVICDILSSLDVKIELNNKINRELENMAKMVYEYWFIQNADKSWKKKKIGEIAEVIRGTMITEEQTKKGNVKVVAGGLDYSYFHSEFNREKNTITISGSGANAGFVNFWYEQIFASDCTTVRGEEDIDTILIYYHLKNNQKKIFRLAKGSAQPHVYPSDIKDIWFYEIPQNIKDKLSRIFLATNDQIAKNQLENNILAQIRDFLLPLLMNGQVKVNIKNE